jgi:hypothetical protein
MKSISNPATVAQLAHNRHDSYEQTVLACGTKKEFTVNLVGPNPETTRSPITQTKKKQMGHHLHLDTL